ncbi:acetyltransferase (GNAT) family protein [Microvirga subterranea]|uniref:Acetyltransferase (GNAT) family protein n=2 Tax=Microvirga subterranea TaxID=186651 RepID=A0A370HSS0_9HYPH|nr:acetyltransferase (GNAT) family protein [Microvirga subterranea]
MCHRLRPGDRWLCTFAYRGDRLVGVLPLVWRSNGIFSQSLPVLETPFDQHTPSGDILLEPDIGAAALDTLLMDVDRCIPNHIGIDFKAIRRSSALWRAAGKNSSGYLVRTGLSTMYSYLDARGSFDGYMAELGSIRKNVRRYRRKLDQRGTASFEVRRGDIGNDGLLAEYMALEAAGWKGRSGSAMVHDQKTVEFYSELIGGLSRHNQWEWHTIRVDGRLVAAQMGVVCGRTLILPKYTFDEDFAECRLGSLLTEEVYRDAFSRPGIDEINHMSLSGPDQHWRMSQDEYADLHLVRREALPILIRTPGIVAKAVYQDVIRPRIPAALKELYRSFRRRGDRKPRRAAANLQGQS